MYLYFYKFQVVKCKIANCYVFILYIILFVYYVEVFNNDTCIILFVLSCMTGNISLWKIKKNVKLANLNAFFAQFSQYQFRSNRPWSDPNLKIEPDFNRFGLGSKKPPTRTFGSVFRKPIFRPKPIRFHPYYLRAQKIKKKIKKQRPAISGVNFFSRVPCGGRLQWTLGQTRAEKPRIRLLQRCQTNYCWIFASDPR